MSYGCSVDGTITIEASMNHRFSHNFLGVVCERADASRRRDITTGKRRTGTGERKT
jgi:hypothetical protein